MNQTSSTDDNLAHLLSQFFKGEMKNPWPAAPAAQSATAEPSGLAAARGATQETSRNRPAAAARDSGSTSRYTLAASVALLLGTCWYLSSDFQTGDRPGPGSPTGSSRPGMLPDAGASNPEPLETLRKDKAVNGNGGGTTRPKIELP